MTEEKPVKQSKWANLEPYIKRKRAGKGGRMCGMKASLLLLGGGWRNEIEEEGGMPERGRKEGKRWISWKASERAAPAISKRETDRLARSHGERDKGRSCAFLSIPPFLSNYSHTGSILQVRFEGY